MIWLIAKKDFLLNLISVRFMIGFVLCLVIIPFTMIVSVDDYLNKMKIYEIEYKAAEDNLKGQKVWSYVRPTVIEKPAPLSIFSNGIKDNIGNKVRITFNDYPLFPTGHANTRDNPLLNAFFSIDFSRVIAILISLLALVFAYDAFTKEREEGTMKLAFTGQVSRISFFFGKLFGLLLTLLPILIFCYLLACLIVMVNPGVSFSLSDWNGIILLFLASIVYMLIFILIGMLISSLVNNSSSAIIISLLSWVWFLFLIPNISIYLSQSIAKIPLYDNVQSAKDEYDREFQNEMFAKHGELNNEFGPSAGFAWYMNGGDDGDVEMYGMFRGAYDKYLKYNSWFGTVASDYADKKWTVQKDYLDQLVKQQELQRAISCLSPSEIFRQVTETLCQTNAQSFLKYMESIREYRLTILQFFRGNRLFESASYFTAQPPEFIVDNKDYIGDMQYFRELFEKDIHTRDHYPNLNVDNVPRYQAAMINKPALLNEALGSLLLLSVLIVLLLLGTIISFMKYDVR